MSSTASRISLRTGAGTVFTPSRFISSSRQRTLSVASNMRWMVPFVRRRADLRDHPGQVALPGGGVEEGESAWSAAQREVAEEIGVPVGRLVPLGAGDPWRFRYLAHEESVVWGLTERIFAGLAPKLIAALAEDQKPDPPAGRG